MFFLVKKLLIKRQQIDKEIEVLIKEIKDI